MKIIEMKNTEFMEKFGPSLAKHASDILQPIHLPGKDRIFDVVDTILRKPLNAQHDAIEAISKAFYKKDLRTVFVVGDPGTGKTLMGAGVVAVSKKPCRVLILCPPHMVEKWKREIAITVKGATIVNLNGKDALSKLIALDKKSKPTTQEFYVIGKERAKGDCSIRPAYEYRRPSRYDTHYHPSCPKCGSIQEIESLSTGMISILTEANLLRLRKCNARKRGFRNGGFFGEEENSSESRIIETVGGHDEDIDTSLKKGSRRKIDEKDQCGEPLYSAFKVIPEEIMRNRTKFNRYLLHEGKVKASKSFDYHYEEYDPDKKETIEYKGSIKAFSRYAPAEYIKRHLKWFFDFLVLDECHEYKGQSIQGDAMGKLAASCKKILCLTGTLTGGYATDIFLLFYRTIPGVVKEDGFKFNDFAKWMATYGTVEKRITENEKTGKERTTTKSCPGISPLIFSKYLMDRAIFIKLADVADELPPYQEEVRLLDMREDQGAAAKNMEKEFRSKLALIAKNGSKKGDSLTFASSYIHASISWPDRSFAEEKAVRRDKHGKEIVSVKAPALPGVFPKEEELLDIIRSHRGRDRRVMVYCTYTDTRDVSERLKGLIEEAGFKCSILKQDTVPAVKREAWIQRMVEEENVDVLITNPELVKTGLDLLYFPTIVFYQQGYNVYTLRQAAKRSWRIGQGKPVEIIFLSYKQSMQEKALILIASKIETALIAEGDISESGIYEVSESPDSIIRDLARAICDGSIESFQDASIAWGKARKAEIKSNMTLLPSSTEEIVNAVKEKPLTQPEEAGFKSIIVDVYESAKPRKKQVTRINVTNSTELEGRVAQLVMF